MAMQFNPYQARATLVDPTASQGGINNLLQMQQNTLNGLVDSFGNIGKTSRTNTVNDLIARGGLEGLNEAQTQARIQAEAGGTLTPEGQAQVDKLLQATGKQDQQKFTTAERLGGQEYHTGERIAGDKTAEGVAQLLNENKVKAVLQDQGYTSKEAEKLASASKTEHDTQRGFLAGESALDRANRLAVERMGNEAQAKLENIKQAQAKGIDPILYMTNGVGMSPDQQNAFKNLSPQEQLTFLDDKGKLKSNVAWTIVPEKRNDKGELLEKEHGRFEDRSTGRRIETSGYKPAEKAKKWYSLF